MKPDKFEKEYYPSNPNYFVAAAAHRPEPAPSWQNQNVPLNVQSENAKLAYKWDMPNSGPSKATESKQHSVSKTNAKISIVEHFERYESTAAIVTPAQNFSSNPLLDKFNLHSKVVNSVEPQFNYHEKKAINEITPAVRIGEHGQQKPRQPAHGSHSDASEVIRAAVESEGST